MKGGLNKFLIDLEALKDVISEDNHFHIDNISKYYELLHHSEICPVDDMLRYPKLIADGYDLFKSIDHPVAKIITENLDKNYKALTTTSFSSASSF